jgi:hypothetical protein
MQKLTQIEIQPSRSVGTHVLRPSPIVLWLQVVTLAWMLVEFGVSWYAAVTAHSP